MILDSVFSDFIGGIDVLVELRTLIGESTGLTQDQAVERIATMAALIESFEMPRSPARRWLCFKRQLEIERKLLQLLHRSVDP